MKQEYNMDDFDSFLRAEMSSSQKEAFEQHLSEDSELRLAFWEHKTMIEAIEENNLVTTLQSVDAGLDEQGFFLDENDIDLYLNGQLSSGEKIKFETRLAKDDVFKDSVALQQEAKALVELDGEEDFLKTLNSVDEKLERKGFFEEKKEQTTNLKIVSRRTWIKRLAIAASFLVLVSLGYFLLIEDTTTNTEALFAANFTPLEDKLSPIAEDKLSGFVVSDKDRWELLQEGANLYKEENYQEAEQLLNQYVRQFPSDETARLYLGIVLLKNNKSADAIKQIEPLRKANTFQLLSEAKWYLGLAYLKNNQVEKAKGMFRNLLQDKDSDYSLRAKGILDVL